MLCTCPNRDAARVIAHALLEAKAAACVSILPGVESHYVWEGKQEHSAEELLLIKTTQHHVGEVEEVIRRHHTYTCPEIIALPIDHAFAGYADWIREQVTKA